MPLELLVRTISTLLAVVVVAMGFIAIGATKGSALHTRAGRVFVVAAVANGLLLAPFTTWSGDVFLFAMGQFVAYAAWAGHRAAPHERPPQATSIDEMGVAAIVCGAVWLAAWAWWFPSPEAPPERGLLMLAFSGLFLYGAFAEWRRLHPADDAEPGLVFHVASMIVALAATLTCLGAVYGEWLGLPSWLVWLAPIAVAVPVVYRWQARVRTHGRSARWS